LKPGKDGASEATTAQRSAVQVISREVEQSLAQKGARDEVRTVTTRAKASAQEGGASGSSDTPRCCNIEQIFEKAV
jgi:hypothetical protein